MGNEKHKDKAHGRMEGRNQAAAALGPETAKPRVCKWKKGECTSTALRGKISIRTCSPSTVLKNMIAVTQWTRM